MVSKMKIFAALAVFFWLLAAGQSAAQQDKDTARDLFAGKKSAIVQIRIIDLASGSKSAIGSGFVVDDSGLIATNYHVIELAASKPEKYRIEYLTEDNRTGDLQLRDMDVINDLALVKSAQKLAEPLALSGQEPPVGVPVFALGNPLDLGLTVVPGTYNGINRAYYYPRVHFTGSLNPGMSGGPTLDKSGAVVGVNVSTAGNQISFLVPVQALQALLDENLQRAEPITDFKARIGEQLYRDQEEKFSAMLGREWRSIPLGEAQVVGELLPFVKCWGGSNAGDRDAQHLAAERSCRSEDNIYLGSKFTTGVIEYQFFWLEAKKLNSWQFYAYYEGLFGDFVPGNRGSEDDVSNFACDNQFVRAEAGAVQTKAVFCTRAYREYPDLYDVLFLQGTVGEGDRALLSHFTLAGISRENALAFVEQFMEVAQWQ